jgi:hypothetical protein
VIGRLASAVFISALIREVNARGGSAAVIAKGDAIAGAILLLCMEKGQITGVYDYVLGQKGRYVWASAHPQPIENQKEIDALCARRQCFDPDLWIVELDIPNAERFIADFTASD